MDKIRSKTKGIANARPLMSRMRGCKGMGEMRGITIGTVVEDSGMDNLKVKRKH